MIQAARPLSKEALKKKERLTKDAIGELVATELRQQMVVERDTAAAERRAAEDRVFEVCRTLDDFRSRAAQEAAAAQAVVQPELAQGAQRAGQRGGQRARAQWHHHQLQRRQRCS
mgnify:CR=1 FL=1